MQSERAGVELNMYFSVAQVHHTAMVRPGYSL